MHTTPPSYSSKRARENSISSSTWVDCCIASSLTSTTMYFSSWAPPTERYLNSCIGLIEQYTRIETCLEGYGRNFGWVWYLYPIKNRRESEGNIPTSLQSPFPAFFRKFPSSKARTIFRLAHLRASRIQRIGDVLQDWITQKRATFTQKYSPSSMTSLSVSIIKSSNECSNRLSGFWT